MTDHRISTSAAPAPAHMFSQGVIRGGLLQVSGQGPVDAETGQYMHPGDVHAQTVLTLRNVEAILAAAGIGFGDVLMLRVYITTRDDFAAMNDAYATVVGAAVDDGIMPCRTTVTTGLPREEMLVEVDALAVVR